MVIVILIVLGICFGSFVNAFIWRLRAKDVLRYDGNMETDANGAPSAVAKQLKRPQLTSSDLSITTGRSMCVHCHHELAPRDLVPVISYLSLRGKCRYCHKPIQDSPLSELLTPFVFVVSYLTWPVPLHGAGLLSFCLWLVFVVGLVALSIYDLRWYELPHRIVVPLIGLALVGLIAQAFVSAAPLHVLLGGMYGALIGGGLFWLLYLVSPKQTLEDGTQISSWIGGGDITLGVLLGLLVGGPGNAILLIFLASLLGTIVAIPLLIAGKASRTSHLPFGPYLIVAAVIVKLAGTALIGWYLRIFLG